MRYERLKDIVDLAIRLQGSRTGVTLADIQSEFSVGRRTAERMRDAVEWAFGPLEEVDGDFRRKHWRLRSDGLGGLVSVSPDELGALSTAAAALERTGLGEHAARLEEVAVKLRALHRAGTPERLEADLEALLHAEGLAMRPGPRQPVDTAVLALLREAILTRRKVEFDYLSRSTGRRSSQIAEPYGLLYGNRTFLVARTDWSGEPRLWRLANVSGAKLALDNFERDPEFDLRRFARRSFGTFQEKPVKVACSASTPTPPPTPQPSSSTRTRPSMRTCRWNSNGPLRGRWPRRNVLAPLHLGRQRHRGEARALAAKTGAHVRSACGASWGGLSGRAR